MALSSLELGKMEETGGRIISPLCTLPANSLFLTLMTGFGCICSDAARSSGAQSKNEAISTCPQKTRKVFRPCAGPELILIENNPSISPSPVHDKYRDVIRARGWDRYMFIA